MLKILEIGKALVVVKSKLLTLLKIMETVRPREVFHVGNMSCCELLHLPCEIFFFCTDTLSHPCCS